MTFKEWLLQGAIWFDQGINWLFWGYADETLSARAYRLSEYRNRHWPKEVIDYIFLILFNQQNHCESAHLSEMSRKHLPKHYSE